MGKILNLKRATRKAKLLSSYANALAKRRPMLSFFIFLGLLFGIIALNSILTPKPKEEEIKTKVKEVSTYKIGSVPKMSFSARVDKENVIQIVAQTPGIVANVNVTEGQTVWRGTNLISLSSNYSGSNPLSVQTQLAKIQNKNIQDTYQAQKDLIGKQRELADRSRDDAQKQREITGKSLDETRNLLSLNDSIVSSIDTNLQTLQNNNTGGVNDEAIAQTKQLKSQFQSATNQIRQGLRLSEYQENSDNPPTKISEIQNDITKKQLDLQEKSLELSKETSALQLRLARIGEASFFPVSPFKGVIQKVHVGIGENVIPGTPLVTLSGEKKEAKVIALVAHDVAKNISKIEDSILSINGKSYPVEPQFVSYEATDGLQSSITYPLPEEAYDLVANNQYITVDLPIGYPDTIKTLPSIPIDIVFQTQDGSYVYVIEDGKAKNRKVELGSVVGKYVTVTSGLKEEDQVILDRFIITGQPVSQKQ